MAETIVLSGKYPRGQLSYVIPLAALAPPGEARRRITRPRRPI
jgi:hypothetical protein